MIGYPVKAGPAAGRVKDANQDETLEEKSQICISQPRLSQKRGGDKFTDLHLWSIIPVHTYVIKKQTLDS